MKNIITFLILSCFLSSCSSVLDTTKQTFHNKTAAPVGQAYIYEKSNLDGTNHASIAVYYRKQGDIEAFKWHSGNHAGTIVKAVIDQNSKNVLEFEVYRLSSKNGLKRQAMLDTTANGDIRVTLGENVQIFNEVPVRWHSYDFDFSSLSYAYRFLHDPKQTYNFHILDLDLSESPPQMKNFGLVSMRFEKQDERGLKYSIDGAGLDNRGGHIWFDPTELHMLAFEIQKPDEPGYESGKMTLKQIVQLTDESWEKFKLDAISSTH